ncbi:hypothetical protein AB4Y89_11030 [Terriglobus sp. 2YAB30_2]|uniref:hypothetical protein n=1 Tax=Terriglobus sp. 2YAB30_2 TaxID=3233023 RepID=UPI003F98AD55
MTESTQRPAAQNATENSSPATTSSALNIPPGFADGIFMIQGICANLPSAGNYADSVSTIRSACDAIVATFTSSTISVHQGTLEIQDICKSLLPRVSGDFIGQIQTILSSCGAILSTYSPTPSSFEQEISSIEDIATRLLPESELISMDVFSQLACISSTCENITGS